MKINKLFSQWALGLSMAVVVSSAVQAEPLDIKITKSIEYIDVRHEGQTVRIQRIQDPEHMLTGGFAKTSRKCPPFCVNAISLDPEIKTVGELEILKFLQDEVAIGNGVLIDARTPEWHAKGTIPGSVNIPFTVFNKPDNDPELVAVLEQQLGVRPNLGGKKEKGFFEGIMDMIQGKKEEKPSKWDFSQAKELLLWCNGIWCGQSPRAIHGLVKLGYPKEKLRWYRGGMQVWRILGLSVVVPGADIAQ